MNKKIIQEGETKFLCLDVRNVSVAVDGKTVCEDISFAINKGEIHALMGPNGSGKSSLALALAGHPEYRITAGTAQGGEIDLVSLSPEARAAAGLFLSFQDPPEVGGVSMQTFLTMIAAQKRDAAVRAIAAGKTLGLAPDFFARFLNAGFSGGEKKKSELLQLVARKPAIAICDEIDSGLDVDALASAARMLGDIAAQGTGLLLISHAPRLFDLIAPQRAHVLIRGRMVATGGPELIAQIASRGYQSFI